MRQSSKDAFQLYCPKYSYAQHTCSAVTPAAAAVAVPFGTEELASTTSTAIWLPSGPDLVLLVLTVSSRFRKLAAMQWIVAQVTTGVTKYRTERDLTHEQTHFLQCA